MPAWSSRPFGHARYANRAAPVLPRPRGHRERARREQLNRLHRQQQVHRQPRQRQLHRPVRQRYRGRGPLGFAPWNRRLQSSKSACTSHGNRPAVLACPRYLCNRWHEVAGSQRYNKRDGVMGVLEVKPSKTWSSVLDVYSSKFRKEDTANQFEVHIGGYNGGYTGLNFASASTAGGILTGGTATGVYPWCAACTTTARTPFPPWVGATSSSSTAGLCWPT